MRCQFRRPRAPMLTFVEILQIVVTSVEVHNPRSSAHRGPWVLPDRGHVGGRVHRGRLDQWISGPNRSNTPVSFQVWGVGTPSPLPSSLPHPSCMLDCNPPVFPTPLPSRTQHSHLNGHVCSTVGKRRRSPNPEVGPLSNRKSARSQIVKLLASLPH